MANLKKNINRRQFITSSIGTAVAFSAGNISATTQNASQAAKKTVKDLPYNPRTHQAMPTRNLGRTGYQVGIFSLGGQATLEIKGKDKESVAIINRAIDLGVNYIDSAAGYGDGTSEKHIGLVIKERRKEVFVASKTHDRSYDGSMRLLDNTLKN